MAVLIRTCDVPPAHLADATANTEVILVLGVERRDQVDEMLEKALESGGTATGPAQEGGGRYQRGFTDPDGHHWEALCLVEPAG
jgi:predicted lactoylglutathione lyase